MRLPVLLAAGSLTLAGVAGGLATAALSGSSQEPTSTTTINVATGATGPTGPPGPAGEVNCGTGFHTGLVQVNHAGGQLVIKTCVRN